MLKIADYLDLVVPYLSPTLVPAAAIAFMRSVTGQFPAALTRCFWIECRLGGDASTADFTFSVTRPERDVFFKPGRQRGFDPSLLHHPLWRRLAEFYQAWGDPASSLYHNVLQTYLEFDQQGTGEPLYRPGFYFGSTEIPPARPEPTQNFDWIYDTALPLISSADLSSIDAETLRLSISSLPAGGYIYPIGVFLAREDACLRICVSGIPPDGILPYLRSIGYSEDLTEVGSWVSAVSPLAEIHLAFDISEGIGPKIGFECRQYASSFSAQPGKEAAFYDFLCSRGCCTHEEKEALLRFPGFMDSRSPDQAWFDLSLPDGGEPHSGLVSTIRRDVSHIKLVFQPGLPVAAKAYLQLVHDWLPPADALRHGLIYKARQKQAASILDASQSRTTMTEGRQPAA